MAKVWVKRNLIITADGGVRELVESFEAPPRKRRRPKSEPAIAVLKHLYPPDGMPSPDDVPDSALERAYHSECDHRSIPRADRVQKSQLLRCAGRKK